MKNYKDSWGIVESVLHFANKHIRLFKNNAKQS